MSRLALAAAVIAGLLASTVALRAQRAPASPQTGLPPDILALACAPAGAHGQPDSALRVTGGQDAFTRRNYGPGDLITINAGTNNGMQVGQEFFVRRLQKERDRAVTRETPGTIRTAGWIRVYAVDDEMSLATIQYACDNVETGDYLEPFVLPTATPRGPKTGKPEKGNYARVIAGNDRKLVFATGEYVIIDRGKDHGIVPGSQFVVYNDKKQPGNFLFESAEAVAVDVRETSSTLHVTFSRMPVTVNDYVAIRK